MTKTRVLAALLLAPPFVAMVVVGGRPFLCLVALLSLVGTWEYSRMLEAGGVRCQPPLGLALTVVLFAAVGAAGEVGALWVLVLGPMLLVGRWLVADRVDGALVANASTTYGLVAVSAPLAFLALLRLLPDGQGDVFTYVLLALVWVQDTAAYFSGRAWGHHRLCPLVSPKKTWEGAAVGFAAGVGAAALAVVLLGHALSPMLVVGLSVVAVAAQVGDLNESLMKRNMSVKDAGGLIPGHGGVLDRFDSLTFAAPVMYAVVRLMDPRVA